MPRRASSYAYEPKWDGFRAMLSTKGTLRVISRRRWNMTSLLPELKRFPVRGVFDGELIAFTDGQPDFVALCDRMLLREARGIPIAFVAFDVLSLEGISTMREPYWRRREILESLNLAGPHWIVTPSFPDGDALWSVVEAHSFEGLVAKPLGSVYKPGERGWLKVKNKSYWKYAIEREAIFERSRTRRRPRANAVKRRRDLLTAKRDPWNAARRPVKRGSSPGCRRVWRRA